MAKVSKITYTFAVTFDVPKGASIKAAREFILNAIASEVVTINGGDIFKGLDPKTLKVHLTNKEVKYGQR